MKALIASRCRLEPLVVAHAREMFAVLSDSAIYEFENAPPANEEWLANRYQRLETRGPAGGAEKWLNWVIRLPSGELAGYVQATVFPDHTSFIAYELNSRYWRQGIGSDAVQAMLKVLQKGYGVQTCIAVLKAKNYRSDGLLRKLGFVPANAEQVDRYRDEPDEIVMIKPVPSSDHAA